MPDDLLSIDEAAMLLCVLAVDVRRLLQYEKLPAIQDDDGKWRISAKALHDYVEKVRSLKPAAPKGD